MLRCLFDKLKPLKLNVRSIIHDNIHTVMIDLLEYMYVCLKYQLALKLAIIMYTSHSRKNICDIKVALLCFQ